jgi:uncharacterized membrane protein
MATEGRLESSCGRYATIRVVRRSAQVCFGLWAVIMSLTYARAYSKGGYGLAWAQRGTPVSIILSVLTLAAMVVCWAGALYVWMRRRRQSILEWLLLPVLVVLGFFMAPFYIIIATHPSSSTAQRSEKSQAGQGS